jgi:hydrogenase/urease accessory protein HupE
MRVLHRHGQNESYLILSFTVNATVQGIIKINITNKQVILMKNRLATLLALPVTLLAYIPTAGAHIMGTEGAGFITGLLHPFMGLDHLLAMIAVGIWAAQIGGSAVWRLPLSFIVMVAVAALLGASGYGLPVWY